MIGWLKKKTATSESQDRNHILNDGLHLAMEWGEDWLKPIQERLSKAYPGLLKEQLDEYSAICQAVMKYGHDQTYKLAELKGNKVSAEEFESIMISRYPWVNSENLSRLFSQGIYYSWKDGPAWIMQNRPTPGSRRRRR